MRARKRCRPLVVTVIGWRQGWRELKRVSRAELGRGDTPVPVESACDSSARPPVEQLAADRRRTASSRARVPALPALRHLFIRNANSSHNPWCFLICCPFFSRTSPSIARGSTATVLKQSGKTRQKPWAAKSPMPVWLGISRGTRTKKAGYGDRCFGPVQQAFVAQARGSRMLYRPAPVIA